MESLSLQSLLFVGFLTESAIFLFRKASEDWKENRWPLLAALLGTLFAFAFDLNLPKMVGLVPSAQAGFLGVALSYVATGMVSGRGANGIHDLLKFLQSNAETAKHESIVAEVKAIDAQVASADDVGEGVGIETVVVDTVADGTTN